MVNAIHTPFHVIRPAMPRHSHDEKTGTGFPYAYKLACYV